MGSPGSQHRLFENWMMFLALLATALAMGAGLAHALALPNKIVMGRDDYFIAQQAYAGWSRLGFLLLVQLITLAVLCGRKWRDPSAFWPLLVAVVGLAFSQLVFWSWTYPANAATDNWMSIPPNWEALRRQWEYSHLAGFGFQLVAFCALVAAALRRF